MQHLCKDIKKSTANCRCNVKGSSLYSDSKWFYSCVLENGKHICAIEYIEFKSFVIYIYSFSWIPQHILYLCIQLHIRTRRQTRNTVLASSTNERDLRTSEVTFTIQTLKTPAKPLKTIEGRTFYWEHERPAGVFLQINEL